MKIIRKHDLVAAALAGALTFTAAHAQTAAPGVNPTLGFNNKIPEKLLTPDKVDSPIGTLNFVDGVPTDETTKKLYDHLDFLRGVEVFLNFIPAASLEAMRLGNAEIGATKSNQAVIMDQLLDSSPLFLTGNTDTVYCSVILDLETDGPTVVEVPLGSGPGTVNDAFFRFVIDMGAPGPDQGKGGKYLIAPAGYKGALPKDKKDGGEYFIARSPSNVNWLILRGFLVDGKPDAASKMFREGVKVYPLSKASNPPKMEFFNGSKMPFNTIHANNFEFYQELDHVIQKEPLDLIEPELRGLAASIGIRKGTPFKPDERMKKILTDAVAVGNATARAVSFRGRDPRSAIYPNSQWKSLFGGADYRFIDDDGIGGRNLDARTVYYYGYTVNTPAMAAKLIGRGSQYAVSFADSSDRPFDGAKTYRLSVPANAPAKDFWSVVLYDPQTRSELQTSQPFPSKNNKRDKLIVNADGSVDIYFGPKAPAGKEANWVASVPNKGWFAIFRLYGPLEPWFDKTWRVGEIEEVK
ncbi:hypothetical protein V1292_001339 [Bradyrhizobium sp. AZCC 1719]|uniref:DUF1254 domain-containing protein n=1 Tax=Bradyrhizobium sp. AZCC 1719 TaxID=3117028 RepID=UPI002FF3EE6A